MLYSSAPALSYEGIYMPWHISCWRFSNWTTRASLHLISGPIHTGRDACKLEYFSFDVACVQCGHPHSHRQVPFACIALRVASHVLCGLGLKVLAEAVTSGRFPQLKDLDLENSILTDCMKDIVALYRHVYNRGTKTEKCQCR